MNSLGFVTGSARAWFCTCFVILLAGLSAFAQAGRGSISGTVSDSGGAVVPGAQVTLLNPATGVTQHTVSSGAGLYTFISLNPGVYKVTASQSGFATTARDKVTVSVDQVTEVNITLSVGAATETITVTGGVDLVEPTSSTVGTLIPSEAIDRVPLLYRNVFDLIQLSAGVIPVNGSPNSSDSFQSIQNISNGRPGIDVSADTINGAINGSVYYMLDGSPIGVAENNPGAILPAMNIPEDGVEEVRVETQNTPASYQSGAAGVISLVGKSGTNQFHGDVFGVFRPDILSANDYFTKQNELSAGQKNTPPDFHRYQEGGAIGGPIKKDKLFFFADYEDTQQQQFEGIDTFTVPTTAERRGDFSALLGSGTVIYDPTKPDVAVTCPAGVTGPCGNRQPFLGNKIPNPNPIALNFLSHFPHCNIPDPASCDAATSDVTNNFGLPGLDPFKAHRFDIRVDWNKSERQRIFTRFSYDHLAFGSANVFNNMWDPNYAQNLTNARNAMVGDDLTLNSSTVLQLRYSFTRHFENQGGDPRQVGTSLSQLGFVTPTAAEQNFKLLPIIVFNDFPSPGNQLGGTGNYNQFKYASENSDVNAAITKVKGKHELSFGFEWMKRYLNVGQPPDPAGAYGFDLTATERSLNDPTPVGGSDFASFLIGMGMTANAEPNVGYNANFSKDIFVAESNPYYAAFAEDTFHASKTLTITAGLRWDIFGGRNERFNRQEYFNPNVTNTVSGNSYTGAEIYTNGGNRSPFTTNMHDFGPRLGFAWQPVQRLVVRGGAGFYYGPSQHNVASAGQNTDGFSTSTPWVPTCSDKLGNTVFNGAGCGAFTTAPVDNFTLPTPYSLINPFPTGVIPTFTSPPAGLANNLGIALSTVLHTQRTPTTYNYNFGIEYELPHQVVVSAAYVGSRGLFLPLVSVDLNELDLATIQRYGNSLCISNECSNAANPVPNLPGSFQGAATVPLWFALQPYPQFGNGSFNQGSGLNGGNGVIINGYPGGDSEYSSLQLKVQKRLTHHFTTLTTFTWGKLITDDGNPPLRFVGSHDNTVQDWKDLRFEHAISPQDVRYQFTGQMSYDLPVGSGRAVNLNGVGNAIAGGWTVNGILYLGTGVPIASPTVGATIPFFNQRPDLACDPSRGAPHTAATWFNYNCFVIPANPLVPGTAPAYLDHVRTMGARELDMSIYKTFRIGEHKDLRFDISAYNLPNKAQFGYPNLPTINFVNASTPPSSANFGQITNTVNTPRQFQFGARFTF